MVGSITLVLVVPTTLLVLSVALMLVELLDTVSDEELLVALMGVLVVLVDSVVDEVVLTGPLVGSEVIQE